MTIPIQTGREDLAGGVEWVSNKIADIAARTGMATINTYMVTCEIKNAFSCP